MDILSRLLDSFPERDVSDDAKLNRLRAFVIAVEGLPSAVLEEAERRIYRDEAGSERGLMLSPPELARLCRAIVAERRALEMAKPVASLERFDAPADPNVVVKFEKVTRDLAKVVDIQNHETKAEWLERMGPRVTLLRAK